MLFIDWVRDVQQWEGPEWCHGSPGHTGTGDQCSEDQTCQQQHGSGPSWGDSHHGTRQGKRSQAGVCLCVCSHFALLIHSYYTKDFLLSWCPDSRWPADRQIPWGAAAGWHQGQGCSGCQEKGWEPQRWSKGTTERCPEQAAETSRCLITSMCLCVCLCVFVNERIQRVRCFEEENYRFFIWERLL